MKPDWDAASPQLARNLRRVLDDAAAHAAARHAVSTALMRDWHGAIMDGLGMRNSGWAGCYRGEGAAASVAVAIGGQPGVGPDEVADALAKFEDRLTRAIAELDRTIGAEGADSEDEVRAVVDLCAWAHGEWVRIHPFANGSGRTARLWVNYLAMRYGLPPFARLRPRPDGGYGAAARASMASNWKAMIPVFHAMLAEALQP